VNPYLSGIGKKLMLPAELTGSTIRKPAQYPIHACRGYSTHHSSRVVVNARKAKIMNGDGELIETLEHSALYQGYQHAFTAATGLPLALRPMVTWQLPLHGKPGENSFCSMTAEKSRTCAACLQLQDRLAKAATQSSCTMTCGYGLSETAVPIRLGTQTIGYLQTGQVLLNKPTPARFRQAVKEAERMGVDINTPRVRDAYFSTPVMSRHKMESVATLLGVFADHLAIQSNQIAVQQASAEPPVITRAKRYIEDHHRDDLSLGQVAAAVNAIDDLGENQSQSILPAADLAINMINELPKPQRGDRPTARALLISHSLALHVLRLAVLLVQHRITTQSIADASPTASRDVARLLAHT
jgi:ligand-binding sensor protein